MVISNDEQVFDFTVSANMVGTAGIGYEVTVENVTSTLLISDSSGGNTTITVAQVLRNNDVRIYLEKSTDNTNYTAVRTPSAYSPMGGIGDAYGATGEEMVLDNSTLTKSQLIYYYKLGMWVSENYDVSDTVKYFAVRVNVYGNDGITTKYADSSGANPTVLNGDMIPVVYDSESKKWVKANTNSLWYDYSNQQWANAVTVSSASRAGTGESNNVNLVTTCAYEYDAGLEGTGASTTGSIYGIYDTAGGTWERTMGVYENRVAQSGFDASFFTNSTNNRYYNAYNSGTGMKGDATSSDKVAGFYGDSFNFVYETYSWAIRGGYWTGGVNSGTFAFTNTYGEALSNIGSRMILVAW